MAVITTLAGTAKRVYSRVKERTLEFLVQHPIISGATIGLAGAEVYRQTHAIEPNVFQALHERSIHPAYYGVPFYASYLLFGFLQDYGHYARPKVALHSKKDSLLKRCYCTLLNHPRAVGLGIGTALSASYVIAEATNPFLPVGGKTALSHTIGLLPAFSLASEVTLRSLRNFTLLRQGRTNEQTQKKNLLEKVRHAWDGLFEHPLAASICGVITGAVRSDQFYSPMMQFVDATFTGLLAASGYLVAGSVLHTKSLQSLAYRTSSTMSSFLGFPKSALHWRKKLLAIPASNRMKMEERFWLAQAYLKEHQFQEAKEHYREAIRLLKSEECCLRHVDYLRESVSLRRILLYLTPHRFFPLVPRHLVDRYQLFAHATHPISISVASRRAKRAFVVKIDERDYEYRVNLALEDIFSSREIDVPSSIALVPENGRYQHFMLRRFEPSLAHTIQKMDPDGKIKTLEIILSDLATLHALASSAFLSHGNRYPLPQSDTLSVLDIPQLDYFKEFQRRVVGRIRGCYPEKTSTLEDFAAAYKGEVIPELERLPRRFIHNDIRASNVMGTTIIDYGFSALATQLIDVNHALDMFCVPLDASSHFLESYRASYNAASSLKMSKGEIAGAFPFVALHNSLCSFSLAMEKRRHQELARYRKEAQQYLRALPNSVTRHISPLLELQAPAS